MNSKQRAYLKGLAQTIQPILNIGKSSLTPEFTESVAEALEGERTNQDLCSQELS